MYQMHQAKGSEVPWVVKVHREGYFEAPGVF